MALYKVDKTTGNTSLVSGSNAEVMRHVIQNELGTALADEINLQFSDGLNAIDDSANGKTKVGVDTTFTEAETRANIDSGDTLKTILGKIKKWFTDIPSLFVSKTGDTMTGALTVKNSDDSPLYVQSGVSDRAYTCYKASDGSVLGYIGVKSDGKAYLYTDSSKQLAFLSDIPDISGKVNKSGDTMTGRLTLTPSSTGTVIESYRTHTDTSSKATDILLGNNIANGTAGSCYGRLTLYGKGTNYTVIDAPISTANRTIDFPDASGTVALTSDIPSVPTKVSQLTNDSGFITSSGTAANVSGTVAIANGGTGATTRLAAAKNLTNEEVTNPGYVVGLTDSWGKFGWTTIGNLKTALGVPAAANNGTLTIQKNGSTVKTFTANSSSNVTANITVPTKLSELTNDVVNNATLTIQKNGSTVKTFTANASSNVTANITVPTKTSDLTNDAKAPSITCSRKTQDYNSMGLSASEVKFFNMNPNSANRPPEEQWFFLIDMMSDDTSFEGQLALGMTGVNSVYYRRKNGTWQSWTKLN